MNPGHDHDAPWPDVVPGPSSAADDGGAPSAVTPPADGGPQHATADNPLTMNPRTGVLLLSGFVTVALVAAAFLMPVHYAVQRPGPALNTLGTENGKDLIAISGHESYPTSGALDLTTVSVFGGPGGHVELYQVIEGWLDPSVAVVPEERLFPKGVTEKQNEEENQREMTSSQESATAAALTSLGIAVTTRISITEVDAKAPAAKTLKAGDVLVSINGVPTDTLDALRTGLDRTAPGKVAAMVVERAGKQVPLDVTTRAGDDGKTQIGVFIDATFKFPFDVKIQIEDIGGPSAGTMFALGIIDKLTPGPLTGGKQIAGTGTMDPDGTVGPIGGIRQKLFGARHAGARWFLAPADNCDEVVGHVPDGLNVVRVATLDEARAAVEKIGKGAAPASLPTCQAS
ncbi:PDZ domain-containing protein [Kineosporia sp. R_H_3]|uniref:YlbL family protein n=1 Tax=Kineosporia sp. R_H_3 TaxID=1961848 RepID=UPI001E3244CC|nr:S16 family serine protease [Kineosporia sp. R_H_3]